MLSSDRQRTPEGRAWTTCQFLPANLSPSAPLGFTFDSEACRSNMLRQTAAIAWPQHSAAMLVCSDPASCPTSYCSLRLTIVPIIDRTFKPCTANVAMLRASSVRQLMVSSRDSSLGNWRPATIEGADTVVQLGLCQIKSGDQRLQSVEVESRLVRGRDDLDPTTEGDPRTDECIWYAINVGPGRQLPACHDHQFP